MLQKFCKEDIKAVYTDVLKDKKNKELLLKIN
jgi:hypothetical protein